LSQENKTDKFLTNSAETSNEVLIREKTEILFDDEKVEEKNLKRKISHTEEKEITCNNNNNNNNIEKRKKLNVDQDTFKMINKSDPCSVPEIYIVKSVNCNAQPNKNQEIIEKTQLVVKEKKKISYISQDVFPLFISLCLQKCPKNDKTDMEKIVDKLKRRYENLDPIYARSENFVAFLNEKRKAIMSNGKKIYIYIEEVMNEMKKKKRKIRRNVTKKKEREREREKICRRARNAF